MDLLISLRYYAVYLELLVAITCLPRFKWAVIITAWHKCQTAQQDYSYRLTLKYNRPMSANFVEGSTFLRHTAFNQY